MTYPAIVIPDHLEVALVPSSSGLAKKVNQIVDLNGGHIQSHHQLRGAGGIAKVNDLGLMSLIGNTRSLVLTGEITTADDTHKRDNQARLDTTLIRSLGAQIVNAGPILDIVTSEYLQSNNAELDQNSVKKISEILKTVKTIIDLSLVSALPQAEMALATRIEDSFKNLIEQITKQSPQFQVQFLPLIQAIFETVKPIAAEHQLPIAIIAHMDQVIETIETYKQEQIAQILSAPLLSPLSSPATSLPSHQSPVSDTAPRDQESVTPKHDTKITDDAKPSLSEEVAHDKILPIPENDGAFADTVILHASLQTPSEIPVQIPAQDAPLILDAIIPQESFSASMKTASAMANETAAIELSPPVSESPISVSQPSTAISQPAILPMMVISNNAAPSMPIILSQRSVMPSQTPVAAPLLSPNLTSGTARHIFAPVQNTPAQPATQIIPQTRVNQAQTALLNAQSVTPSVKTISPTPHKIATAAAAIIPAPSQKTISQPHQILTAREQIRALPIIKQERQNFSKTAETVRTLLSNPSAIPLRITTAANNNAPSQTANAPRGITTLPSRIVETLRDNFKKPALPFLEAVKQKSSEFYHKVKDNKAVQVVCVIHGGVCRCAQTFKAVNGSLISKKDPKISVSIEAFEADKTAQADLNKTMDRIVQDNKTTTQKHEHDLVKAVQRNQSTPTAQINLQTLATETDANNTAPPKRSFKDLRAAQKQTPNPA